MHDNKLLLNEKILADIFENTGVMIAYLDLEFNFIAANSAYLKGCGHSIEELIGKNHFKLFPNPENQAIFEKVRDTGNVITFFDKPFEFADQPERGITYWDWILAPVKGEKGLTIGVILSLLETTQQKRAKEALTKSEERYQSLFANMINAYALHKIILDDLGRPVDYVFLEVNDSFERFTGLKRTNIIGKRVTEVIPSIRKDHVDWIDKYGKVATTGKAIRFENYSTSLKKWYSISAYSPEKNYFVTIFEDITERKKAENKVVSLSKFPLENPNPVLRLSKDSIILFSNPAGKFFLNEWKKMIGEKAPAEIVSRVNKAFSNKNTTNFEYYCSNKTFIFSIAPINEEGYANIYGIDISARKEIHKKLLETKHDLDHAQQVGRIGSWRLDVQQNILLWSDENHRIFGIPKGTPMTYETFLNTIHPEDREYVDKKWKAALLGEPYNIEHRIIVDGKVKTVWEKAVLEFDNNGKVKGGFGTTQDITEFVRMREKLANYRKHLEELVEEKTKQLRDAERMVAIGETAGMIGHDIRNPLQSMDGAIFLANEYVKSLPDEFEEKKDLKEINELLREQVLYIDHMIADLQDFAKKAKPMLREIDLSKYIIETFGMVKVPENIIVNVVFSDEPLLLFADSDDLKRVLSNLFRNAIQAMPDGGELTILTYRKDGDVLIRVEDTGVGIPKEALPKIFTPLFTTKSKGQGFGLAVCKKIIEAHNGEITFQSKEGKGTTFTIKLPIKNKIEYF